LYHPTEVHPQITPMMQIMGRESAANGCQWPRMKLSALGCWLMAEAPANGQ
jgi:hypothetical protein